MKIETLDIKALQADPKNARRHDDTNLKAIKASLSEFGQRKPIVITSKNVVVAGNGTLEAARALGWVVIDAVRVTVDWTASQIKAFAIADNRTAELADWDKDVLSTQLIELKTEGWDISLIGFGIDEKEKPEPVETDADEVAFDSKYEIVIECADEAEQYEMLTKFMEQGLKVRAIVL